MSQPKVDMRSLREILEEYCRKGWFLFPIKRETKRPAIYDNLKAASNDIEQLMKWADKFPNCNWGLSLAKSGFVAVDVDAGGLNKWAALTVHNGEPATLKAKSGSGVGSHYVFKADPKKKYRGKIDDGLDVKHNGYITIYPSIHERTKAQYQWVNEMDPQLAPEWINKLIVKEVVAPGQRQVRYKFASNFYQKIAEQLKQKPFGYDEWTRIGMALHSAFNGDEEGLNLYLDITEGVNFQDGDLEKAKYKWETFRTDGGAGAGTLVFIARDLGCEVPNPQFENDKELFAKAMSEEEKKDLEDTPKWNEDKYHRLWTAHVDFLVDDLNAQGYAVLMGSREGAIIKTWMDESGVIQYKEVPRPNFKDALASYNLKAYVPDAQGVPRPKLVPACETWLRSKRRKQYSDVVFRPHAAPEGALNLWTDIPCARKAGNFQEITEFIETILCSGNKDKAAFLIKWLAQLVQQPEIKSTIVPVLMGDEGTGKGFFTDGLMRGILKSYYCRIDKPGVIMERFNADQARKLLTVLDEAAWRGNYELMALLKSLTGNDTMTVEQKFGGRDTIENYSRYVVTTNDQEAVSIGATNRRFLILNVSSIHLSNPDYYTRLWATLKNGAIEAFFDHLMTVDLTGFNPKDFPKHLDDAGETTKLASHGTVGAFWWDILFENPKPIFETNHHKHGTTNTFIRRSFIFDLFLDYANKIRGWEKGVSVEKFWRQTAAIIPKANNVVNIRKGSTVFRGIEASPYDFAKSLCSTIRVRIPDQFDDLACLKTDDFDVQPHTNIGTAQTQFSQRI